MCSGWWTGCGAGWTSSTSSTGPGGPALGRSLVAISSPQATPNRPRWRWFAPYGAHGHVGDSGADCRRRLKLADAPSRGRAVITPTPALRPCASLVRRRGRCRTRGWDGREGAELGAPAPADRTVKPEAALRAVPGYRPG